MYKSQVLGQELTGASSCNPRGHTLWWGISRQLSWSEGTKANQYQRRVFLINEWCRKQVVQRRLEGQKVESHKN